MMYGSWCTVPNDPKNQNFEEKNEKMLHGDIILLYIHVYHKWRSYDIWFLKYKVQQTQIFIILGNNFPFSPLTTWKIKILTLKKTPGDIIILHICTTNDNHMMYGSWDMEGNRQFFVTLDHFLLFYPSMDQENLNFENMKKTPEDIIILQMGTIDDSHLIYGSWYVECSGQNFLSFWTIFCTITL